MDERELKNFKQQLLAMKDTLHEQENAADDSSSTVELDQSRVGRLSRMDALQSQQMALETIRRRQQQLVKIEGALRRIESGDFGFCFVCDEEINHQRLSIDPTSTRCMKCIEE